MTRPLPHHLHTRLSVDQWQLLEATAAALDLTLSGAVRHHLDVVLDRPLAGPGSPTRRELLHEERNEIELPGHGTVTFESLTLEEAGDGAET